MKLGVVGSRTVTEKQKMAINILLDEVLRVYGVTEIVSGGALGVDTIAKEWAIRHNIKYVEFLPKDKSNPSSYHERNQQIVDYSTRLIAFWDMKSPGTKSTIDKAHKAGKEINVLDLNTIKW